MFSKMTFGCFIKNIVFVFFVGFFQAAHAGYTAYDAYFSAHPDDWQIFQGFNTYQDFKNGERVVIFQVTAGDAGRTDGWWQAREKAAMSSVRWMVGSSALESTKILLPVRQ